MKKYIGYFITVCAMLIILTQQAYALTAGELNTKLNALQTTYPTGTHQSAFYNSVYPIDKTSCYKDLSGHYSWECMAWGSKVFDYIWGKSISQVTEHKNVSDICIGDYVRYNSGSYDHSILITNIVGDKLYYTDCNAKYDGIIRWGQETTKSKLQTKVNNALTNTSGHSYGFIAHYPGNTIKGFVPLTVTFNPNGGTTPESSRTVYQGSTYGDLPTPQREGYTFTGWYTSATGGTRVAGYSTVTASANHSIYAQWTINSYSAKIYPNGGEWNGSSDVSTITQNYNTTMAMPEPIRKGYRFVGWAINKNGILEPYGKPLVESPFFTLDLSSYMYVYNNLNNGNVTHERIEDYTFTEFGQPYVKIKVTGEASPQLGGFKHTAECKSNGTYYHIINAKIPQGYNIQSALTNNTDNKSTWLTSKAGTGDWCTYIYKVECGQSAAPGSFGFVYISGEAASADKPVEWMVAYSQMFDATGINRDGNMFTFGNGNTIMYAMWDLAEPHIVAEVAEMDSAYMVNAELINVNLPCELIVAGYKDDRLVIVKNEPAGESNTEITIGNNVDKIKVFAVNNMTSMKPMCKPVIILTEDLIIE